MSYCHWAVYIGPINGHVADRPRVLHTNNNAANTGDMITFNHLFVHMHGPDDHDSSRSIWFKSGFPNSFGILEVKLKHNVNRKKKMKQQSGEGRITWQFCDEMDNLMAKKPEISPVATASNGDGFKIDEDDCEHSNESDYTSEPVASRKSKTKKRKKCVNRYDDALNEFEQNRFILGGQARDTLTGDDECIDHFSLNCRPSNYVNPNDLYEYSKPTEDGLFYRIRQEAEELVRTFASSFMNLSYIRTFSNILELDEKNEPQYLPLRQVYLGMEAHDSMALLSRDPCVKQTELDLVVRNNIIGTSPSKVGNQSGSRMFVRSCQLQSRLVESEQGTTNMTFWPQSIPPSMDNAYMSDSQLLFWLFPDHLKELARFLRNILCFVVRYCIAYPVAFLWVKLPSSAQEFFEISNAMETTKPTTMKPDYRIYTTPDYRTTIEEQKPERVTAFSWPWQFLEERVGYKWMHVIHFAILMVVILANSIAWIHYAPKPGATILNITTNT
ncbi:hypothetical protein QYM36_005747, partial [Artemia franciscana]